MFVKIMKFIMARLRLLWISRKFGDLGLESVLFCHNNITKFMQKTVSSEKWFLNNIFPFPQLSVKTREFDYNTMKSKSILL
jgi:hypothetical protein